MQRMSDEPELSATGERGDTHRVGADRFDALYAELHAMAGRLFRSQRQDHTLQPTALIHEAYLKMAKADAVWNDRTHFMATAARAMRQILVNHARDKNAGKRGGGVDRLRVTLSGVSLERGPPDLDLLTLNEALERLSELDARQARVAELRLFGGLTTRETADAIEMSPRTVELEWRMAKSFLAQQLGDDVA
jgi:RNA polymerase sigma-70 factor (ECF subfamily)